MFTPLGDNALAIRKRCWISLSNAPWRPRLGEIITVVDKSGLGFRGRVCTIQDHIGEVYIFECLRKKVESPLYTLLLQALPEKERMEWIIQKATELGVNAIVPFFSKRSTTLEEREKRQAKAHRWPVVTQRAAQQSRRATVPVIEAYTGFHQALQYADGYELKIILWEKEPEAGINNHFTINCPSSRICLLVGPEGGFTGDEVQLATQAGFIPIGLGPRILRTETAAIAILTIVQYKWGDMG